MQQFLKKKQHICGKKEKNAGKIRRKVNFIESGKEKTALFITVRQKGDFAAASKDFAAVTEEKLAIFIARRKKSKFCSRC